MVAAIACVDLNFGIGYKNQLLFNIKEDLEYFKSITKNSIVIMGHNTWKSLPKKPLPNRVNIVITNNPPNDTDAIYVNLEGIKNYLDIHAPKTSNNIFIIGGESIYKELLPYCEHLYLTRVHKKSKNTDTYFPNIDITDSWELSSMSEIKESNDIKYQFCVYDRKGF